MTRIEEIEQAVSSLPAKEYRKFRQWFLSKDWSDWDYELEADVAAGRLDFLGDEARKEKETGKLKEL
jgi:hypothetical protein